MIRVEVLVFHVKDGVQEGAIFEQPVAAFEPPAGEQIALILDFITFQIERRLPAIGERAFDLE
jgi:hypothetical protein